MDAQAVYIRHAFDKKIQKTRETDLATASHRLRDLEPRIRMPSLPNVRLARCSYLVTSSVYPGNQPIAYASRIVAIAWQLVL